MWLKKLWLWQSRRWRSKTTVNLVDLHRLLGTCSRKYQAVLSFQKTSFRRILRKRRRRRE